MSPCLRMSQPMPPAQADAADAGVAHDAAGGRQTVRLRLVVDIAPQGSRPGRGRRRPPGRPRRRGHRRQVDDDPAVAHRGAGDAVAPAAHGDLGGRGRGRSAPLPPRRRCPGSGRSAEVVGRRCRSTRLGRRRSHGGRGRSRRPGTRGSSRLVLPSVLPRGLGASHHRGHREEVSDLDFEVRNLDFTDGRAARDTAGVRTYGQYCPIARGAEIFAERWTPLIIRNLHLGCETFGEILEGAPGLSRTLLTQRLNQLERLGIVESAPKARGAVTGTSSRARATICSRSASPSANGEPVGSRSPPRTSIRSWRCGRCATRCVTTGSRTSAWSSGWTSPASGPTSGTGCWSSAARPRSARRIPARVALRRPGAATFLQISASRRSTSRRSRWWGRKPVKSNRTTTRWSGSRSARRPQRHERIEDRGRSRANGLPIRRGSSQTLNNRGPSFVSWYR